jgi:hypothetical protein
VFVTALGGDVVVDAVLVVHDDVDEPGVEAVVVCVEPLPPLDEPPPLEAPAAVVCVESPPVVAHVLPVLLVSVVPLTAVVVVLPPLPDVPDAVIVPEVPVVPLTAGDELVVDVIVPGVPVVDVTVVGVVCVSGGVDDCTVGAVPDVVLVVDVPDEIVEVDVSGGCASNCCSTCGS